MPTSLNVVHATKLVTGKSSVGAHCRPFYLPREISCVVFIVIYIPPSGDANRATEAIASVALDMQQTKPEAAIVISVDFDRASLHDALLTYVQYVNFNTRGRSCLDLLYSNIKDAYKTTTLPPIGRSDHTMIPCLPTYIRKLERQKPMIKTIRQWTEDTAEQLGGCFACTDWNIFEDTTTNINEYTNVITDYIKFCEETIIPTKEIKIYPSSRPWVTNDHAVRKRRRLWMSGHHEECTEAQKEMNTIIAQCKDNHKKKIEETFRSSKPKKTWSGLNTITGYKKKLMTRTSISNDEGWANELNVFYSRFEKDKDLVFDQPAIAPIRFEEEDVRRVFMGIQQDKAQGTDGLSPRLLKTCAQDLAPVFTENFIQYMS
ncbi:hypothetical protein CAPTEDRAFT_211531 [Capitella teleta]|uniref:Reverse transcriptase domain-containing protein n=1 Tax=Capitella teleta TaxID=283909 RepID=R7TAD2_CAPTE|nr:hypothetical protein CAPTEDRAFT_211531 [Capitella teleta]|eukprot:ELT90693.1 hypothetical protein CAPTEDRAFT_211531 [Capitella teleta]